MAWMVKYSLLLDENVTLHIPYMGVLNTNDHHSVICADVHACTKWCNEPVLSQLLLS